MYTNGMYENLYNALLEDFNNVNEFISLKRCAKKNTILSGVLGLSYVTILGSVFSPLKFGLPMVSIGVMTAFLCQSGMKRYLGEIKENKENLEDTMKVYIDSNEYDEFRKKQASKLKGLQISKTEYLNIVKEDLQLIHSLMKIECAKEDSINIVGYKSSIQKLFSTLKDVSNSGLISTEDVHWLESKWDSDLQVLSNYYAKTPLEVELKYLRN